MESNFYNLLQEETRRLNLPRYEVKDVAPETLKDLVTSWNESKTLIIWSGASDNTIWTKEGNWLFRAWHDFRHINGNYTFDAIGEGLTCIAQKQDTESTVMHKLLDIEIMSQLEYQAINGTFPVDQISFFNSQLKK